MTLLGVIFRLFNVSLGLAIALGTPMAHASDDSYPGMAKHEQELRALSLDSQKDRLAPQEAFLRTQSVLKHLGVPEEPDSQAVLNGLARRQNLSGAQATLKIMDPKGTFSRFIQTLASSGLEAFQDFDSRKTPDFAVTFAEGAPEQPLASSSFHQRLKWARSRNTSALPLAGLRIAIDPGHMGSAFWDRETGKIVHDGQGHSISEGVINLQTALLLEQAFQAQGAEVLLTHRELAPVSSLDFATMDLRAPALSYIRDETLVPWFQDLLGAGPADSAALFAAADSNPGIKSALAVTGINRDQYFILGEDLIARADAINQFIADIALVIHFDTNTPPDDPNGVGSYPLDGTKVYVVGSYDSAETSSREQRAYFARHLLDATSWNASLALGRDVVSQLHADLKVPYGQGGGGFSNQVEPGIFARNLGVSRRVNERALTYIECLYYNDPSEFSALLKTPHAMQIGGVDHPYSDRLAQVAAAIQKGVLNFVSHYGD